LSNTIKKKRFP